MTVTDLAARRLLLVHAHPDDEVIGNGATMARYAAEGVHVTLVTCTLGEEGEVLVPELVGLGAEEADQLGGYRIGELAAALRTLGVRDHRFLGGAGRWRDSGMMGTPANDKPRAFWRADVEEASRDLVAVIREVRPQVLVTYDENGGYGHPDHIQAHRVAMRAVELAADPAYGADLGEPWQVAKVYWGAVPRSLLAAGIEAMRAAGHESPFGVVDSVDDLPFGTPDELVTTAVDGTAYADAKYEALKAHATQISLDGPFFALSDNLGREGLAVEHYILVRGRSGPGVGERGWEDDLFAGLG
jgi:N-acetyl-1-D-myo-inositol-2-amino-2-deoxy-alpha-D-glucopyranoside deacetylase